MKAFVILLSIGLLFVIIVFSAYVTVDTGSGGKSEDNWYPASSDESFDGSWGTELLVEYEDGSTVYLNINPLFTLPFDVTFQDKKVSSFEYILSVKVSSEIYNTVDINMIDFEVIGEIENYESGYGMETTHDVYNVDTDGKWHTIYSINVDRYELLTLPEDYTYNLTFTPVGVLQYRFPGSDNWVDLPLPSWYYVQFKVRTDADDVVDEPDEPERWIDIELSGGEEI